MRRGEGGGPGEAGRQRSEPSTMPALKFLQQTTEEKRTEASEAHSRASLSRLPARYRSGEVYNLAEEDEEEGGGRMTMRRGILTRRRNRHSLFFFFTLATSPFWGYKACALFLC